MAALNQGKIYDALKQIVTEAEDSFIFSFLLAYGTPKATIKLLQMADKQTNVAQVAGDVALAQKIYFHPLQKGEVLQDALDGLLALPLISQHKIRFVMVTDFKTVLAYDAKVDDYTEFDFDDFKTNYEFFLPLTGQYEKAIAYAEHPADVKACEKMGRLYDRIRAVNHYENDDLHSLNVFLTRLLFCFFAEDTGIFREKNQVTYAVKSLTKEDGSDLTDFFETLFLTLNLPDDAPERKDLSATFQTFPYVNGGLFKEQCPIPQFDAKARRLLLDCGHMTWSDISPVIFGAMFQAVMDPEKRRSMGAHYTSEENILKVVRPLFLDALYEEFEQILTLKSGKKKIQNLHDFQRKLGTLGFLDPACGCGNFLIVSYRELKNLELQVLLAMKANTVPKDLWLNVKLLSKVTIDQFYGIELEEFPVEIARVSMWLMEHVMNLKFGEAFGAAFPSIPLQHSAEIVCANALATPWEDIIQIEKIDYIFGNPPFSGRRSRTESQQSEVASLFPHYKDVDYVACWIKKTASYMQIYKNCMAAFVATNSIVQGEQVSAIWKYVLEDCKLSINFAYPTFKWKNEAKNNAIVHCIIVGFSAKTNVKKKYIIDENNIKKLTANISPYLIESGDTFITPRAHPICPVPNMQNGNVPLDGDALKVEHNDYALFKNCIFLKRLMGGNELLKNINRYVLWLAGIEYSQIENMPNVLERVELCRKNRLGMKDASSKALAETPMTFRDTNNPDKYIAIPIVSSEKREYIPMAYLYGDTIPTNQLQIIPNATDYDFAILTSAMHMTWMRTVCGRLKSDYRYSRDLCYNTFPWPTPSAQQKKHVESLAETVLMTRERYPDMTLADMYDPDKMPELLREAHTALDMAVDGLYRKKTFVSDEERLQHLFTLYEKLVSGNPHAKVVGDNVEETNDD